MKIKNIHLSRIEEIPELQTNVIEIELADISDENYFNTDSDEIKEISIDVILDEMKQYDCDSVFITGEEPLFYKELIILINALFSLKEFIYLKTNGILSIKKVPKEVVKIVVWNIYEDNFIGSFLIENLFYLNSHDYLKLPFTSIDDIYEIINEISKIDFRVFNFKTIFETKNENINKNEILEFIHNEVPSLKNYQIIFSDE